MAGVPLFRAKAPLRLSFAGGGTDVPPFSTREGGLVLSATVNRYAYGSLTPRDDDRIGIESADLGMALSYGADDPLEFDGRLDLAKAAIRKLGRGESAGFDLFLHSSVPPGSGLGASSTIVVVLVGLLKELHQLPLTDYEVAELAYVVERTELGIRGGLQDQYAATFGGFNFMEFDGDRVVVNPLRVHADTVDELEHNLLLCFTGATRSSDHIIDDQMSRFEAGSVDAIEGLRMQKKLAVDMKNALLQRRLNDFGELLGEAWRYKQQLSSRISTPFIEEAYELAIAEGALGGKVTGAGGGGYMVFYCRFRQKHRVAEALTRLGAKVEDFAFDSDGLHTWRSHED